MAAVAAARYALQDVEEEEVVDEQPQPSEQEAPPQTDKHFTNLEGEHGVLFGDRPTWYGADAKRGKVLAWAEMEPKIGVQLPPLLDEEKSADQLEAEVTKRVSRTILREEQRPKTNEDFDDLLAEALSMDGDSRRNTFTTQRSEYGCASERSTYNSNRAEPGACTIGYKPREHQLDQGTYLSDPGDRKSFTIDELMTSAEAEIYKAKNATKRSYSFSSDRSARSSGSADTFEAEICKAKNATKRSDSFSSDRSARSAGSADTFEVSSVA